jgi:hypothetical protein
MPHKYLNSAIKDLRFFARERTDPHGFIDVFPKGLDGDVVLVYAWGETGKNLGRLIRSAQVPMTATARPKSRERTPEVKK